MNILLAIIIALLSFSPAHGKDSDCAKARKLIAEYRTGVLTPDSEWFALIHDIRNAWEARVWMLANCGGKR